MKSKNIRLSARYLALLAIPAVLAACGADDVDRLDAQNSMDEASTIVGSEQADPAAQARVEATPADRWGLPYLSSASQATACLQQRTTDLQNAAANPAEGRVHNSENAAYAVQHGWYPDIPEFQDGVLLPCGRIVAYYGNPNSTRMGALGRYPKDEMLTRLRRQVEEWERADPNTPVIPALHMVAVVAQGDAGTSGHYRSIMRDADVEKVYEWAQEVNGIFFVDIQVGTDDIRNILPRFEWILQRPDVHLGIDPEFMMKDGSRPGSRIGTMDAADINYASEYLANLVREHDLPPKVFIVHRFTQRMVTNYQNIRLRPEVQIVMHMDGWGEGWLKRDTFDYFVVREPVEYSGFKIFYDHDARSGAPVLSPTDMLKLHPVPLYIQYQ
jgi:hypothetical protein